jgi:polyferredoxin
LINAVAGRTFYSGLLWSFLILLPTLFLGRFFCGWICPMGSLNHILSRIGARLRQRKKMSATNGYKKWQRTKYVLLIAGMFAAVCRSNIVSWVDPLSWLVRSMGLSALPTVASKKYFVVYQPHYGLILFLCALFLALLAMNLCVTRFWCRALCPLGALLGIAARWSILGLQKDASSCKQCRRCLVDCQGGDDPIVGMPWHKAECHLCLNCVESCPHGSLKFSFFGKESEIAGTDLNRRKALTAMVTGLAIVPILRAQTARGKSRNERLVRPPGALGESDFLSRCIRCGECLRVCPNNALQPAFDEAGLEGLWTPVVTPKIGYCEPSCVLCTDVCPTGAIQKLTPRQKAWVTGEGDARNGRI